MIGKISMGSSFKGCISYCLEDKKLEHSKEVVFENRAEVIAFNQCFGNKKELIEQFNDVRKLNQKVQKPVMHVVLSLTPGEQLEKATLAEMAGECAKEMGFDKNQYIAVAHIDTNHQHLHLVVNRVGYDGKVVRDSNNYKKISDYCRKMEIRYNLKKVLSPRRYLSSEKRNIPRMDARKEKLRENIRECLSTSKSYNDFERNINQKGYEIIKGRGISFIDRQAVKVKGSEVGYSLQKIEKILGLQQQLQQVKEDKIKKHQHLHPGEGKAINMTYQLYKQTIEERDDLDKKEDVLSQTLNIMLRPETNEANLPAELQKEAQKKKRRGQHL